MPCHATPRHGRDAMDESRNPTGLRAAACPRHYTNLLPDPVSLLVQLLLLRLHQRDARQVVLAGGG